MGSIRLCVAGFSSTGMGSIRLCVADFSSA